MSTHTVGIQVYAVYTGSSNGDRLPLDRHGALRSFGEVGLLTIPGDAGIGLAQGTLCSLVELNEDLCFDQGAVDEARSLVGWRPPPELDAAFVTEVDGLPLMLSSSSASGYKHVILRAGHGTYKVAPPDSFPARARRDLKVGTYATALEAASDIVRQIAKGRESVAASRLAGKERKRSA